MRDAAFTDARDRVLPTLESTHKIVAVEPDGDPTLRYALPVPRGWVRAISGQAPERPDLPRVLGVFAQERDISGPRIIVQMQILRFDVPKRRLLSERWASSGWSVLLTRPFDARLCEVGGMRQIGDGVDVRKTTAFIDGARLFRVDVAASTKAWPEVHDLLWPCGPLMMLCRPTYQEAVEPRQTLEGPRFRVELPESWTAGFHDDKLVARTLVDDAIIIVEAVDPHEDLARRYRRLLQARGFAMARTADPFPLDLLDESGTDVASYACAVPDDHPPRQILVASRSIGTVRIAYVAVVAYEVTWSRYRTIRALEIAMDTTKVAP